MSQVLRFAPALGDWVRLHLVQGEAPSALVDAMQSQGMALAAAKAIVDAFCHALREGKALPVDHVVWQEASEALQVQRAFPMLARGPMLRVPGRDVRVLARVAPIDLAVLADVMDADECAALIDMARPRLRPSTLVDPLTGRDVVSAQRVSLGMFFRLEENALVARLDQRFAALMGLPVAHGEGLQVLHYPTGAGSSPHFDFLVPSNEANRASIARSGQRVRTMVTYLNDVPAGGETVFPALGCAVTPRRGHAVCFADCDAAGEPDPASLHASQAVESSHGADRSEKWVVTKWMRARPFQSAPA
ncbi:2OG-Fe(II) oxygenase [Variovorax ginsengisoli]|uniref:Prolyl 4-hydroxylase n=1 Tax=Variovorax ginsengisoli TaxID=363844 RepID=A0ABT9SEA8_9BURK|nr:2OG-Fe(II) oxygenase [Variovorax ginsengisoli]MDP9902540.1 prolyl 4-hydroxylase [Variovorax ginsengisoli]